jgi:hypothetical protein
MHFYPKNLKLMVPSENGKIWKQTKIKIFDWSNYRLGTTLKIGERITLNAE